MDNTIVASLAVGLAALLTGCGGGGAANPAPSRTAPAPTVSSDTPPTGAYFLDLRTGSQTPLPSTSSDGAGYGAAFNDGHYYAASPDGSRVYWEDACCTATDVAAEANQDGSQGGRRDPTGRINFYAGGWSPDGTKFVYQRRDGREDDQPYGNLFVEDKANGTTTRITDLDQQTPHGWWYLAPTFSPDGRDVIFQMPHPSSGKFALWSVPVTGGEPTLLVANAAQPTTFDGSTYAYVRPIGKTFAGSSLVIATTSGVRTLVEATTDIFEPKMSPDGRRIAYSDNGSIHVVDVMTGVSQTVADGRRMAAWLDEDTLIVAVAG